MMEFAGGVAFEGEQGVVAKHAAAVVEGVFEEFLDDGGGALDDFFFGDFIGYTVREDTDATRVLM